MKGWSALESEWFGRVDGRLTFPFVSVAVFVWGGFGRRLYKAEVLKAVLPRVKSKGYTFQMEMLVRAAQMKYRVGEVPYSAMDFVLWCILWRWGGKEGSYVPLCLCVCARICMGLSFTYSPTVCVSPCLCL